MFKDCIRHMAIGRNIDCGEDQTRDLCRHGMVSLTISRDSFCTPKGVSDVCVDTDSHTLHRVNNKHLHNLPQLHRRKLYSTMFHKVFFCESEEDTCKSFFHSLEALTHHLLNRVDSSLN